jgi:quinol monooxygenase YgiN
MTRNVEQGVLQVSTAASRAAYEAVERIVRIADDRPAGMIVHAVAEDAGGSVLIVDVWESDAAMDVFERERLLPAFAALPADPRGAMPERPVRHPAFLVVRA